MRISGNLRAMSALVALIICSCGDPQGNPQPPAPVDPGVYEWVAADETSLSTLSLSSSGGCTLYDYVASSAVAALRSFASRAPSSADWVLESVRKGTYADESGNLTLTFSGAAVIDEFGAVTSWDTVSETVSFTYSLEEGVLVLTDGSGNVLHTYEGTVLELPDDTRSYAKGYIGDEQFRATRFSVDLSGHYIYLYQDTDGPVLSVEILFRDGMDVSDLDARSWEISTTFLNGQSLYESGDFDYWRYNGLSYNVVGGTSSEIERYYFPAYTEYGPSGELTVRRGDQSGDCLSGELTVPALYCTYYQGIEGSDESQVAYLKSMTRSVLPGFSFRLYREDASMWKHADGTSD